MSDKPTLPGKPEAQVIDVSLRQVLAIFGGLVFSTLTVGISLILLRDYARYRRQMAVIEAVTGLVLTVGQRSPEGNADKPASQAEPGRLCMTPN